MVRFFSPLSAKPIVVDGRISQSVLAANDLRVKVREVSWLPFGGVHVTSGAPIEARFPGQWFQVESGLHQNWMRDYDPTTGRYLEPDPLGLVDGASVYGYARQSPLRWTDRIGLFTLGDAMDSLYREGVRPQADGYYSDQQIFDEWLRLEKSNTTWLDELLQCPCSLEEAEGGEWQEPRYFPEGVPFHPGGLYDLRSRLTPGGHASQCIYDANGVFVTLPPGAGSADFRGFTGLSDPVSAYQHWMHDVVPFNLADSLGRVNDYYDVRPVTP